MKEEDSLLHWVSHWQEEVTSLAGVSSWYLTRYWELLHEYLARHWYARRWYSRQLCLVACKGGLSPLDGDPGGEGEGGGVRAGHVWGWRPGGGWLLGAQVGQVTSSHTLSPPFSSHFT